MAQLTNSEASVFDDAVSDILAAASESEVCQKAVDHAALIFDVELVGMWLYDTDARQLQLTAQTQRADELFGTDVVYEPGNSVSWRAFENSEVFCFSAGSDTPKYNPDSVVEDELIVPVSEYGVFNIASETGNHFSEPDIELAKTFQTIVVHALNHLNETHALRVKNDRIEDVLSMVSHDIRNPLTVAQGRARFIQNLTDDTEILEQTETIVNSLDRMETLAEDLLLLADKGYVVESRARLSVEELATAAWQNVDTKDAELDVAGSMEVFGERRRLLQVFENLFRNAIEHGGEDVSITVRPIEVFHTTTRGGSQSGRDGFVVADDGVGLPEGEELDLFKSGTSTSGSGLGLTIVERIVDAHGWNVVADTSPTGGAQFTFTAGEKAVMPFR